MPELLLRDVPEDIVEALRRRAAAHGRTADAELRSILEEALHASREPSARPGHADFWERAAKLREQTRGRNITPSEELIRQDRDER
ncbi:MAG: Arc family DNA-binding protein [Alphaproteobacteria bacterium]